MVAVPGKFDYVFVVQDAHGDVAVVRMPSTDDDVSANAAMISDIYTVQQALGTALAATMNGKIVQEGFSWRYNRAQKPAGPLSTYAHVYQACFLNFGDGRTDRIRISIPTPKTTDLLADGITVNPADTNVGALITAVEANLSSDYGHYNEYLGGRFREGKPRRRTNLYNATA